MDIVSDAAEFTKGKAFDGVLLWYYLRATIKPSTKVGVSQLKTEIKTKTLADFDNNVKEFNKWFAVKRLAILVEEGPGYNEYLRQLFRAYLGCDDRKFEVTVEEE